MYFLYLRTFLSRSRGVELMKGMIIVLSWADWGLFFLKFSYGMLNHKLDKVKPEAKFKLITLKLS